MGFPFFILNLLIVAAAYILGGKALVIIALWCWGLMIGIGMVVVGLRKLAGNSTAAGAVLALAGSGLMALAIYHVMDSWRTQSGITLLAMVAVSAVATAIHLIKKN